MEAEPEEYPDQRGEILLEIVSARLVLGEPDRALVLWRDLITEGGEDGDYARVEVADARYSEGHNLEWQLPRDQPCWCGSENEVQEMLRVADPLTPQ